MSMVPVTPNMDKLKSFWEKPQGKVGMATLALGTVAVGLAFMNYLLPYAATFVDGWLHILMTGGACVFLIWFYLNFHQRFSMMFRIIITRLTNIFWHVMPVDVLEDNIKQMKKRQAALAEQIGVFKGQVRGLSDTIAKNNAEADHAMQLALQARKSKAVAQAGSTAFLQYQSAETLNANAAARKHASNESYGRMLTQMKATGSVMERMQIAVSFFIDDRTEVVNEAKTKYNTLKSAHRAVATASGILHGSVDEESIFQNTLEYMNDQDSQMLGEIENYQDMAQQWLSKADLETGVMNDKGMADLNAFEQKLLTPGSALANPETAQFGALGKPQPLSVPVAIPSGYGGDDYFSSK